MRRKSERIIAVYRISELQFEWRIVRGCVDEGGVGEAYRYISGERGNGRVCALDLAVRADCFDALQVITVGQLRPRHVTKGRAVLLDRPLELVEAGQGCCCWRPATAAASAHFSLCDAVTEQQAMEHLHDGKPVYSCPMHQHVFMDKNETCPICGMNLQQVKEIRDGTVVFEDNKQSTPMDMKGMNDKDMQKMMESE